MKAFAFAALAVVFLSGCQSLREEVQPLELTEQAEKLVVAGFISPQDSVLSVRVSRSQTILDETTSPNGPVTDATVLLSGNGTSVTLAYNARKQCYQVEARHLPVRNGQTYELSVRTPQGERVTGRCTVPKAVTLKTVTLDSVQATDRTRQFVARYAWNDPAGETNFYQTTGTFTYVKQCPTCRGEALKPESVPVAFTAATGWVLDETRNGSKLQTDGSLALLNPKATFGDNFQRATVQATLLHVDEAYFRYHQAVEKATAAKSKENPFAEPVLIPSNVQGGLGCFAAYNRVTMTVGLR